MRRAVCRVRRASCGVRCGVRSAECRVRLDRWPDSCPCWCSWDGDGSPKSKLGGYRSNCISNSAQFLIAHPPPWIADSARMRATPSPHPPAISRRGLVDMATVNSPTLSTSPAPANLETQTNLILARDRNFLSPEEFDAFGRFRQRPSPRQRDFSNISDVAIPPALSTPPPHLRTPHRPPHSFHQALRTALRPSAPRTPHLS